MKYIQMRCFLGVIGSVLIAGCSSEPPPPPVDTTVNSDSITPPSSIASAPVKKEQTREQLREKAKSDPEGADADAIGNMSQKEVLATAINSAGFLCARVTDMYPSAGKIMVSCVEYRNGNGHVRYRIDANAGSVEQIE